MRTYLYRHPPEPLPVRLFGRLEYPFGCVSVQDRESKSERIITFAPSLAAGLACLLTTPARPAGVAATSEPDAARRNSAVLVKCMVVGY